MVTHWFKKTKTGHISGLQVPSRFIDDVMMVEEKKASHHLSFFFNLVSLRATHAHASPRPHLPHARANVGERVDAPRPHLVFLARPRSASFGTHGLHLGRRRARRRGPGWCRLPRIRRRVPCPSARGRRGTANLPRLQRHDPDRPARCQGHAAVHMSSLGKPVFESHLWPGCQAGRRQCAQEGCFGRRGRRQTLPDSIHIWRLRERQPCHTRRRRPETARTRSIERCQHKAARNYELH